MLNIRFSLSKVANFEFNYFSRQLGFLPSHI